jgi:hypothetical protein
MELKYPRKKPKVNDDRQILMIIKSINFFELYFYVIFVIVSMNCYIVKTVTYFDILLMINKVLDYIIFIADSRDAYTSNTSTIKK